MKLHSRVMSMYIGSSKTSHVCHVQNRACVLEMPDRLCCPTYCRHPLWRMPGMVQLIMMTDPNST